MFPLIKQLVHCSQYLFCKLHSNSIRKCCSEIITGILNEGNLINGQCQNALANIGVSGLLALFLPSVTAVQFSIFRHFILTYDHTLLIETFGNVQRSASQMHVGTVLISETLFWNRFNCFSLHFYNICTKVELIS